MLVLSCNSGHYGQFNLSWDEGTGELALAVNGANKGSVIDTEFSIFSQIYIRSNTNQCYDNISIIPEPGSFALMALGILTVLSRRRPKCSAH